MGNDLYPDQRDDRPVEEVRGSCGQIVGKETGHDAG